MHKSFQRLICDSKVGSELFFSDSFSKQLIVLMEERLRGRDFTTVSEFESYFDQLEEAVLSFIREFNQHKKGEFVKL